MNRSFVTVGLYVYVEGSNTTSSGNDDSSLETSSTPWWYTVVIALGSFAAVFILLLLRDILIRCFGLDCGQGTVLSRQSSSNGGRGSNNVPDTKVEKQRRERRLWYTYYLQPFVTVLTAENFQLESECAQDNRDEDDQAKSKAAPKEDKQLTSDDEDQLEDVSLDEDYDDSNAPEDCNATLCRPVGTAGVAIPKEEELQAPTKWMKLWDFHSNTFHTIEANCAICLLDYEEGDTIVQSAAKQEKEVCVHVFHFECMMHWLSLGKKRCPFCRHWFVPADPIKDQMEEAHVETTASRHHLNNIETMETLATLSRDTDSGVASDDAGTANNEQEELPRATISNDVGELSSSGTVSPHYHHHHHHHQHTLYHQRHVSSPPNAVGHRVGRFLVDPELGLPFSAVANSRMY